MFHTACVLSLGSHCENRQPGCTAWLGNLALWGSGFRLAGVQTQTLKWQLVSSDYEEIPEWLAQKSTPTRVKKNLISSSQKSDKNTRNFLSSPLSLQAFLSASWSVLADFLSLCHFVSSWVSGAISAKGLQGTGQRSPFQGRDVYAFSDIQSSLVTCLFLPFFFFFPPLHFCVHARKPCCDDRSSVQGLSLTQRP